MESPCRKAAATGKARYMVTQKSGSKERKETSVGGSSTAGKADNLQLESDDRLLWK